MKYFFFLSCLFASTHCIPFTHTPPPHTLAGSRLTVQLGCSHSLTHGVDRRARKKHTALVCARTHPDHTHTILQAARAARTHMHTPIAKRVRAPTSSRSHSCALVLSWHVRKLHGEGNNKIRSTNGHKRKTSFRRLNRFGD